MQLSQSSDMQYKPAWTKKMAKLNTSHSRDNNKDSLWNI